MEIKEILLNLIKTPSVSGFEENTAKKIMKIYGELGLEVEVDVMGNVIGKRIGRDEPKIMFAAHMDQIGLIISYIDKNGYLYFKPRGFDRRILYGMKVMVHGSRGSIIGVIGAKPAHLVKPEERDKAVKVEEMAIDIGAESKDEVLEMGINLGAIATPILEAYLLGKGDKMMGVGLDDKAGVASIIRAIDLLKGEELSSTVYAVATTQEEVGLRGAVTATYNIHPHIGIAIDVTHASSYNVSEKRVSGIRIGGGPAIGVGPNFHPKLTELIMDICKSENIPYQVEPILGASGTDAWAIQVSRGGVATALISIPLRYMHSPGEVISIVDVENIGKLLAEIVRRFNEVEWRKILRRI
ncbi:MAG: M42 family peptidase [Candidatus Methanomethylicota archaeon]|nr:MAG: M42 family peptidase [Candidatus Verstraetearchaeota archaeon]